ncbi:MAG: polysaccharide deacetylase family protein [Planctomycetes bacterium]|jgi:peptidoglycan/xylan/chitin deacetylase (PgdA/CDA1 family)|nr:polysaccharide deacetylase family protein [Planctomycetota bacterium]
MSRRCQTVVRRDVIDGNVVVSEFSKAPARLRSSGFARSSLAIVGLAGIVACLGLLGAGYRGNVGAALGRAWGFAAGLSLAALLAYLGVPWAYCRWNQWRLRRWVVQQKRVVLTLDDGPGRQLTRAVLELLAARGVKAVFFLLGRNVRENQDLVRHIHAQGHEIGSHTYDHLHAWKVAPWRSLADIRRGFRAIDDALGTRAGRYPFRPPYGKLNLMTLLYLLVKRIPIVYWTIDSGDTSRRGLGDNRRAAQLSRAAGGGVVLAHDFDRQAREYNQYVLDSLRATLDTARECGLQPCTFSQLRTPGKGGRR